MFSVHISLLPDQIYPTQIQQHLWISLVGIRYWRIVYTLLNTHGSFVDVVCCVHYSRNTETGKSKKKKGEFEWSQNLKSLKTASDPSTGCILGSSL